MPEVPNGFFLRRRVNQLLAERRANVRLVAARSAAERATLGEHLLVTHLARYVIVRDHVDLYEFAREIGAVADEASQG